MKSFTDIDQFEELFEYKFKEKLYVNIYRDMKEQNKISFFGFADKKTCKTTGIIDCENIFFYNEILKTTLVYFELYQKIDIFFTFLKFNLNIFIVQYFCYFLYLISIKV